uniref:Tc1-like transposase DDE domain-containing protein n=1 Tax=Amphilophus citrinellus TaxID=61819 RepID=A0A3Q0RY48_AMPCI
MYNDNASPHRTEFFRDYLQNLRVERMEWAACSPDLSPSERLWDQLGNAVCAKVTKTTTLA